MRFRQHRYAVITDIIGMFMQICIDKSQWNLQRIFWRESPSDPLTEYYITVVTYGLASSGFVAVRSMIQCAKDYSKNYPKAAEAIKNSFYMDDGLLGHDSIEELKELCKEVKFVPRRIRTQQMGIEISDVRLMVTVFCLVALGLLA